MLKTMINNSQNFRSEYSGTNTNPEDQLVPNVPPLFYQNEPKETKPKQKVSNAGSDTSVAGAGTMSRGGKGVLKSRNTPIVAGTLGKKGKRIAMPGTPMPTMPTGKVNDKNSENLDYHFSPPPPPEYDPNESDDIMEDMPPPPPPMMGDFDLDNMPPPPPPDFENIPPPPPPNNNIPPPPPPPPPF